MKYFGKKIAAMGAAVMMAVSMMSMGASAKTQSKKENIPESATWRILIAPGANSAYNHTVTIGSKYDVDYLVENCDNFCSSMSNTKVTVTPTVKNQEKKKVKLVFAKEKIMPPYWWYNSSFAIVDTNWGMMRYFVNSDDLASKKEYAPYKNVKKDYTISLKYSAQNVGIYCGIDGTVHTHMATQKNQ